MEEIDETYIKSSLALKKMKNIKNLKLFLTHFYITCQLKYLILRKDIMVHNRKLEILFVSAVNICI